MNKVVATRLLSQRTYGLKRRLYGGCTQEILPYDTWKEVRLKNAYIIMCTGCKKDEAGNIVEIQAEYDPDSKSGMPGIRP